MDCGQQLKVGATERCRACHLRHMSSDRAVARFAAARATGKAGVRTSKSEIFAEELLDLLGKPYRRGVPYGRWVLDFVLREEQTVIEVHGTYWHDRPDSAARDLVKRAKLEEDGYRVLFWRTDKTHLWWLDFVPAP